MRALLLFIIAVVLAPVSASAEQRITPLELCAKPGEVVSRAPGAKKVIRRYEGTEAQQAARLAGLNWWKQVSHVALLATPGDEYWYLVFYIKGCARAVYPGRPIQPPGRRKYPLI